MIIRVGAIDESSINQLSLVSYLVKNIAVSADSHETTMYDLSYFAPKFLWILRDFVLEIRDVRGNVATPQQYLESALCDVSHVLMPLPRSGTSRRTAGRHGKAS